MIAEYVPPKRTPCTALELAQAYELVLGGDGKVNAELIAVLMAHATLECGRDVARGLIATSCFCWNLGNVKAGELWPGHYTSIRLNEYLTKTGVPRALYWFSPEGAEVGGTASKVGTITKPGPVPPGHPQTRMRALESLELGVKSKISFLMQSRFARAWQSAKAGKPRQYAFDIHQQKYYTADPELYARGIESLYRTHLPVALKIASEPLRLADNEEHEIDRCIDKCSRSLDRTTPEHVAAVQLDLSQTWQAGVRDTMPAAAYDDEPEDENT